MSTVVAPFATTPDATSAWLSVPNSENRVTVPPWSPFDATVAVTVPLDAPAATTGAPRVTVLADGAYTRLAAVMFPQTVFSPPVVSPVAASVPS